MGRLLQAFLHISKSPQLHLERVLCEHPDTADQMAHSGIDVARQLGRNRLSGPGGEGLQTLDDRKWESIRCGGEAIEFGSTAIGRVRDQDRHKKGWGDGVSRPPGQLGCGVNVT
jgi:hypothetical protein